MIAVGCIWNFVDVSAGIPAVVKVICGLWTQLQPRLLVYHPSAYRSLDRDDVFNSKECMGYSNLVCCIAHDGDL